MQLSREMLLNCFIAVCGKGNFGDTRSVWGPWGVTETTPARFVVWTPPCTEGNEAHGSPGLPFAQGHQRGLVRTLRDSRYIGKNTSTSSGVCISTFVFNLPHLLFT
jgi:hypothetical protein